MKTVVCFVVHRKSNIMIVVGLFWLVLVFIFTQFCKGYKILIGFDKKGASSHGNEINWPDE